MSTAARLLAVILLMVIPLTASARPPEVVFESEDTFSDVIPAGVLCAFEVMIDETARFKVTEFYDTDGSLKWVHEKVSGTTVWSTPDAAASENWSYSAFLDFDTMTVTQVGNVFNIHAGAGGVIVNDKGRIVIDLTTHEALEINGPHQAWEGQFDDLCEALAG